MSNKQVDSISVIDQINQLESQQKFGNLIGELEKEISDMKIKYESENQIDDEKDETEIIDLMAQIDSLKSELFANKSINSEFVDNVR
jgi:hypothetical protein